MSIYLNGRAFFTGNLDATGYISGVKCGASAFLTALANTNITTAGTFYPIQGTFSNAVAQQFSGATVGGQPAIQYDGTKTQYFEIDWHSCTSGDKNNLTGSITIKKNDTVLTDYSMDIFMKTAGECYHDSGTVILELAQGDTVQLVATSDIDASVITFSKFVTTLTEFFD